MSENMYVLNHNGGRKRNFLQEYSLGPTNRNVGGKSPKEFIQAIADRNVFVNFEENKIGL